MTEFYSYASIFVREVATWQKLYFAGGEMHQNSAIIVNATLLPGDNAIAELSQELAGILERHRRNTPPESSSVGS